MAEQNTAEQNTAVQTTAEQNTAEQKKSLDNPIVYDIWIPADGIIKGDNVAKYISFKPKTKEKSGFMRVIGGDEGYTSNQKARKFYVPAEHDCEVFSCNIMFTRE